MPRLDIANYRGEYKEMLRAFACRASVRNREMRKSMDGSRTLPISCEKRQEMASGHAGTPLSLPCLRVNMHKDTWRKYFSHNKRLLHSPVLELQPFRLTTRRHCLWS